MIDEEEVKHLLLTYASTTEKEQDVVLWIVHKVEAEESYRVRSRLCDARDEGLYEGKADPSTLRYRCRRVQQYIQDNIGG